MQEVVDLTARAARIPLRDGRKMYVVAQRVPGGWYEFAAVPAMTRKEAIWTARRCAMRSGPKEDFRANVGSVPRGMLKSSKGARKTVPSTPVFDSASGV